MAELVDPLITWSTAKPVNEAPLSNRKALLALNVVAEAITSEPKFCGFLIDQLWIFSKFTSNFFLYLFDKNFSNLNKFEFLNLFEGIVVSGEEKTRKPFKKIYKMFSYSWYISY